MLFTCPHCDGMVEIQNNQFNCRIVRHGIFKHNGHQVPQHASKQQCDLWVTQNIIRGCGKPSKIEKVNNEYFLVICGYI